jgi:hypothetical protein
MLIKLGDTCEEQAFVHGDVYEVQQTSGPPRLCIGASGGHIDLLIELAESWGRPEVAVLYVLVVGIGAPEGRYQSPWPLPSEDAAAFCRRFRAFLESDGRHHLWLASPHDAVPPMLVYDRHNRIYAYGDLDAYTTILQARGMQPGTVHLPSPHTHYYHREFDDDARALLSHWEWLHSPLREQDGE